MPRDRQEETGFVVNDRRKFTTEGDVRPDAPQESAPEPAAAPTPIAVMPSAVMPTAVMPSAVMPSAVMPSPPANVSHAAAVTGDTSEPEAPEPTPEEHAAAVNAYSQSNVAFDRMIENEIGADGVKDLQMTFERLVGSMHMTGLMQLGLVYQRDQQPRLDILGARQTIDTLTLLQEKTKGNTTENEEGMMRNSLYELRVSYLEVTQAMARQAQANAQGAQGQKPGIVGMPGGKPGIIGKPGPTIISG